MSVPTGFRVDPRNSDEIVRIERLYLRADALAPFLGALVFGGTSAVLILTPGFDRIGATILILAIVMLTISLLGFYYLFRFFRTFSWQREIRCNRKQKTVQLIKGGKQRTFSYYVIQMQTSGSEYKGGRRLTGSVILPDNDWGGKLLKENDIGLSEREQWRLTKDQPQFFELELFFLKSSTVDSTLHEIDHFMHYFSADLKREGIPYKSQFGTAFHPQPAPLGFYAVRAYTSQEHGEHQLALNDLNQALRLNPNVASVLVQKANALNHLETSQEAITCLSNALELLLKQEKERVIRDLDTEISFDVYFERAGLFLESGQHQKALADINTMIDSEWGLACSEHYLFRGKVYLELQEYEKAIDDFNWCTENDEPEGEEVFEIHKGLGKAYLGLKKSSEAVSHFKQALALKSDREIEQLQKGISP